MNIDLAIADLTRLRDGLEAGTVTATDTVRLEIRLLALVIRTFETELEYQKLRASDHLPPAPSFAEVNRMPMTAEDIQKLQAAIRLCREVRRLLAKEKRAQLNQSE